MSASSPSSIPPAHKHGRFAAYTTLITGVGLLLAAYATRVTLEPKPHADPPPHEDASKPIPVPPKEEPTTDKGEVATRVLREHANDALIEHRARIVALEDLVCALKKEARETRAELLALQAGKRGPLVRAAFLKGTKEWALCTAVTPETRKVDLQLGELRDAAGEALQAR
jgi:hypothetical protein